MKIDSEASSYVDLPQDERIAIGARLADIDTLEAERAFVGLSTLINDIARSVMPNLALEMGLLRLATRPRLVSIEALLEQFPPEQRGASNPPPSRTTPPKRLESAPMSPASNLPNVTPAEPTAPPKSQEVVRSPSPEKKELSWEEFVVALRDQRPALGAVLEHGVLMQKANDLWVIGFPEGSFFGRQADKPEAREALRSLLEQRQGYAPKIEIRVYREQEQPAETLVQKQNKARDDARENLRREALTHPMIIETMQIFSESTEPPEIRLFEDELGAHASD
jgi:DNA polymerase-3 subunit gamma/tau